MGLAQRGRLLCSSAALGRSSSTGRPVLIRVDASVTAAVSNAQRGRLLTARTAPGQSSTGRAVLIQVDRKN